MADIVNYIPESSLIELDLSHNNLLPSTLAPLLHELSLNRSL